MDLELKEFEEKINNITEQFMSLLNSDEGVADSVGNKFEGASIKFEEKVNGPTIFNNVTGGIGTTPTYSGASTNYDSIIGSTFDIGANDVNFGGIRYGIGNDSMEKVPSHAIRFDSVEQNKLNDKLEELYNLGKDYEPDIYCGNPNIAFSDSNLRKAKSMNLNMDSISYGSNSAVTNYNSGYVADDYTTKTGNNSSSYTNDKTCSTLNDKEVYEMANNNGVDNGNPLYNFATIPADKSLVERKNWKEVLFMDIPWDTKIDLWGGFKKFCTAQIKITF